MHALLSIEKRLARLRRRRDEIAAWRERETIPVGGFTFDGTAIERGQRWPELTGVHRFQSAPFDVPKEWPLKDVRLGLDVGGESPLRICYAGGTETTLGLDINHTDFRLDQRKAHVVIDSVAKGPFGTTSQDPRLKRAELVWLEVGVFELARLLSLIADAAQHLEGHDVQPLLLELAENAIARLEWPTATEAVLSRRSRFAARWGERESDGEKFAPVPLDSPARESV